MTKAVAALALIASLLGHATWRRCPQHGGCHIGHGGAAPLTWPEKFSQVAATPCEHPHDGQGAPCCPIDSHGPHCSAPCCGYFWHESPTGDRRTSDPVHATQIGLTTAFRWLPATSPVWPRDEDRRARTVHQHLLHQVLLI